MIGVATWLRVRPAIGRSRHLRADAASDADDRVDAGEQDVDHRGEPQRQRGVDDVLAGGAPVQPLPGLGDQAGRAGPRPARGSARLPLPSRRQAPLGRSLRPRDRRRSPARRRPGSRRRRPPRARARARRGPSRRARPRRKSRPTPRRRRRAAPSSAEFEGADGHRLRPRPAGRGSPGRRAGVATGRSCLSQSSTTRRTSAALDGASVSRSSRRLSSSPVRAWPPFATHHSLRVIWFCAIPAPHHSASGASRFRVWT